MNDTDSGHGLEVIETTALQEITKGEVDIQVTTARRFPRSIRKFQHDALSMATIDRDTAASCFYALPRGGNTIEGPSTRLAEIVAGCWGNLRCESRVTDIGNEFVTAQGTAWDMERNVLIRTEVKRRITNRSGARFNEDMITVTGNAAASIAFRNAVFKVVPSAYVNTILDQARSTAVGDSRTLVQSRAAAFAWLAKAGAHEDRVLALLKKTSIEDVGLEEVKTLRGLATAIKEGTTTVDESFPTAAEAAEPKPGVQSFGKKKPQPVQQPEQQPAEPSSDNGGDNTDDQKGLGW